MTREEFTNRVKREQKALRGFLLALCCGKMDDADDIAQDACIKAYLASADFSNTEKFRAWLFKIAYNTFLNHKASMRTFNSLDEAKGLLSDCAADAHYQYQELYLALSTLQPKERSALTLFYLNSYSIREIAAITGSSEDAVKKQLSRGRDNLKKVLKR